MMHRRQILAYTSKRCEHIDVQDRSDFCKPGDAFIGSEPWGGGSGKGGEGKGGGGAPPTYYYACLHTFQGDTGY